MRNEVIRIRRFIKDYHIIVDCGRTSRSFLAQIPYCGSSQYVSTRYNNFLVPNYEGEGITFKLNIEYERILLARNDWKLLWKLLFISFVYIITLK